MINHLRSGLGKRLNLAFLKIFYCTTNHNVQNCNTFNIVIINELIITIFYKL
jgi:hypothetical protein